MLSDEKKALEKKYLAMSPWERNSEKNKLESSAEKLRKRLGRLQDLLQQIEKLELDLAGYEDDAQWCRRKRKLLLKEAAISAA